jgi:hypothetical protein
MNSGILRAAAGALWGTWPRLEAYSSSTSKITNLPRHGPAANHNKKNIFGNTHKEVEAIQWSDRVSTRRRVHIVLFSCQEERDGACACMRVKCSAVSE